MRKVRFDPTVSAGNLFQILTFIIGVSVGYLNLVNKVDWHSRELKNINSTVSELSRSQAALVKNLEVLTAIVNERTLIDPSRITSKTR